MTNAVDRETTCGLGPWRPSFMQRLASKKVYMFFYGALGIVQGMLYTYLSATLSTLEKQFGIKSKEAAYMMSGNEFSQILFVFVMPLLIRLKRRPLWTSVGLFFSAIGCFLMAVPHLMAGDYDESAHFATAAAAKANASRAENAGLCSADFHPNSLEHGCNEEGGRSADVLGLVLIFVGIVLTGVGNCAFYTFGLAYLDDNTSHENSPIMLGITYTFRLLGPTLGFLLGTACLKTYVYPHEDPGFGEHDPRWIGAWWLGYPIIGTLILIFAGPLACFPQRLPKEGTDAHLHKKQKTEEEAEAAEMITDQHPKSSDDKKKEEKPHFWQAMLRLFKNKLFMYNFFSSLFFVFAFMGFGTFMPKYVEYQFRKSAAQSSTYSGLFGTVSKAIGLLASGFAISKFKPSARFLSGYNVVLGTSYFCFLILFAIIGCPTSKVYGTVTQEGDIDISGGCNLECECPQARLAPICSKDGVTNFYSPCQAGCMKKELLPPEESKSEGFGPKSTRPKYVYDECSCVAEAWRENRNNLTREWIHKDHLYIRATDEDITNKSIEMIGYEIDGAVDGWCPVDCDDVFKVFLICTFILMVVGATGRIGNVLVALRCIEVRDKSLSMAFNMVFLSLFAMLPSPMVYGAIIDSTCVLWQRECGETTNCLLYDSVKLRRTLMLTTAFIMLFGVFCDIGVWYHAKDVKIFNPDQKVSKEGAKKDEMEDEEEAAALDKLGEKFTSNLSLSRTGDLFANGGAGHT